MLFPTASRSRCIDPAIAGVTVRTALHSTNVREPLGPGITKSSGTGVETAIARASYRQWAVTRAIIPECDCADGSASARPW